MLLCFGYIFQTAHLGTADFQAKIYHTH